MKRICLSFVIVCLLVAVACSGPSDAERARKYRQAAVTVVAKKFVDGKWQWIGGSGVLIRSAEGIVLTTTYVIADRKNDTPILCYLDTSSSKIVNMNKEGYIDAVSKDKKNQCAVLEEFKDLGISVLQLATGRERGREGVKIGTYKSLEAGEPIYGMHSPHFLHGSYYKGYLVTAGRERGRDGIEVAPDRQLDIGEPVYGIYSLALLYGSYFEGYLVGMVDSSVKLTGMPKEFNATEMLALVVPSAQGSSGSMVLDRDGQLVGILVAGGMVDSYIEFAIPMGLIYPRIKKYLE